MRASASRDGARVAFDTTSSNRLGADGDNDSDIYLKDLTSGELTLVSVTADGSSSPVVLTDTGTLVDSTEAALQHLKK